LSTGAQENETVISLKKYLDMVPGQPVSTEPALNELSAVILESYRSALLAVGKSGALACPAVGSDLQQTMASLEARLSANVTASVVKETEKEVEKQLLQWGGCTAEYFKTKANEVKELLIVLARTAESMGERDHRYANHFSEFTAQLQTIADLEDIGQVRSTLVQQATELRNYVDRMAQDSRESVAQLQAEVSTYETKLKAVEQLASQDALTGLANRRKVEERIEWRIAHQQVFCIVILDLDRFKQVNDTYGHPAGDNLLQQFSQELRSNSRSTDIVGRWGGDEFIVVLDCDLNTAKSQVERVQKWVLGEYTIPPAAGAKEAKVKVGASIGIAQWQVGQTMQELISRADSTMYREKALSKSQKA
jgi:diguanylate cyclase (GGDEF)-like protein